MEDNIQKKELVFTLIEGVYYLEHTEILKFLHLNRTTFQRLCDKLGVIDESEIRFYKNRKLIDSQAIYDFWRRVSASTWGK